LSERQSAQLVWSPFINTHGRQGTNIPCDLHIEHLNRRLKNMMSNLVSNINHICPLFEEQTSHQKSTRKYGVPSSSQDLHKIIAELTS